RRPGRGELFADAERTELSFGGAKLGQAHLAGGQFVVTRLNRRLVVDETRDLPFFEADTQGVPVSRAIMRVFDLRQHVPGIHVRTVEAAQPQSAVGWINPVMHVAAVGAKYQPRGPFFVVQLYRNGDFERRLGKRLLRKAHRPAAESLTETVDK